MDREEQRDKMVIDLINSNVKISKINGKRLAQWYLDRTGIDETNCMCNRRQIKTITNIVKTYLEEKKNEDLDDQEGDR